MSETQPAMAYPTEDQYTRWQDHADRLDMSVSEFMQAMVEAGLKKFAPEVTPDETNAELREQRNDLKEEVSRYRDRVAELEDRLHRTERQTVKQYVEQQGAEGVTYEEVVQHLIETVPSRANRHLDSLEGEAIRLDEGRYYPTEADKTEVDCQ